MPAVKEESFSFGGVDSRSNPANFPPNRALRCLNFAPQSSGAVRLRPGYTLPPGQTTTSQPIHSAIYYEQFSAAYLGPQFVLHGHGTDIRIYDMVLATDVSIGAFTTSNPWGHFRSNNRIFFSDGVTNNNWDGTTLRLTGIPSVLTLAVAPQTGYASTATDLGGSATWTNPGNIVGPPDSSYAIATTNITPFPIRNVTNGLLVKPTALSVPLAAQVLGLVVVATGHISAGTGITGVSFPLFAFLQSDGTFVGPGRSANFLGGSTDSAVPIGGQTDTWNAGLTAAMLNDPSFKISLQGGGKNTGFGALFPQWNLDSAEVFVYFSGVTGGQVQVTSSSLGSIAPTQLSGYQLFAAIYDPITQHMGNRGLLGNLQTVGATLSAFVITGLTALSTYNPEWEYALGMTNDGGQVPYWFVDAQGNNIVLGNAATMGTVYLGNVNAQQELPVRNDVPPPFDKYARVGTRIFAGLAGNPFLSYSNDVADISNASYVGRPEESWPADQQEPLPDGLLPMSIHAYRLEGWFFSRENLHIWSQFLLQQGVNPWRGPWPGGCAGQRAFIETPHGPFWISAQKQLCTFMEDGVISVSSEYEVSLLGKIADTELGNTELGYLLDQESLIDQIVIRGLDSNGNPVIVVHDFNLADERSQHGQGYMYQYGGLTVQTFVGAGYTPRQNVYDTSARMRLWVGAVEGFLAQIEDGLSDNGATYSGDYIGLVGLGTKRRSLIELEFQGDPQLEVSYLPDYSLAVGDFIECDVDEIPEDSQNGTRYGAKMTGEPRWVYLRMQLTSHPSDGNFNVTDPPFLPLPSYGVINATVLKLGAERGEARG